MPFLKYDLHIYFEGEPAREVTSADALLYAYSRIGQGALTGGSVVFSGGGLDAGYRDATGFVAGLMGAENGAFVVGERGRIELVYDITGLEPLILRNSDKNVIKVKKNRDTLIDIALIGVIYDDLPDILKDAVQKGNGVNSSVILSSYERFLNETNKVKNTYNIINDLRNAADLPGFTEYNELYYGSLTTVIASAIYGCISSGKRLY